MKMNEIIGSYNLTLVVLSLIMATIGSYTSLDLANSVVMSIGWKRKAWLFSGAVAMGTGIWSMHFVAMLAFHLPQPVTYDLFMICLAVLIAIAASLAGLYFANIPHQRNQKLIIGGIFMGMGISGMHYVGMNAMQGVHIQYNPVFVSLSILIAIGTSIFALMLFFPSRDRASQHQRLSSSVLMGFAIFGMHFTGMKAAMFSTLQYHTMNHFLIIDQSMLAIAIAVFTMIMHLSVLISSYINQRFKTQMEEQREEKLQALSDLTSALAHEIRNPLQVNRGFLQLLNEHDLPAQLKGYINICMEEIDRANSIIGEYLSFSKPQAQQIESIDVAEQIRRVINITSSFAMMHNVELNSKLASDCKIKGNAQKFNQSLINIIKNGVEAMPDGGTLLVRCRTQNQDVIIDIIDQGVGMTNEQIKRLGSPFYSLKEKGTGLGLMVSYRIIHSFCGKINVVSEKGRGTTFSILFPQINS